MYLFHFLSHYSAAYTDREIKNYDFSLPYKCNILPNLAISRHFEKKIRKNFGKIWQTGVKLTELISHVKLTELISHVKLTEKISRLRQYNREINRIRFNGTFLVTHCKILTLKLV